MRTNFNIKNRNSRQGVVAKSIIVIILVAIVITFLQVFNNNPLGGLLHGVIRPVLVVELTLQAKVDKFLELLKSKQSLVERNVELKDQLSELQPSLHLINLLKKENSELKALSNRDIPDETILASVLIKPPVSLYDTLVVDVGEDHGISEGDLVLVHDDFVVGTVTEVYRKTSLVVLFSSRGKEMDVTLGDEHLLVKALGRGGGNFATQLPRGVEVALGDIVILPNISTQIFGIVELVIAAPADQFQTILFKNPVNMAEVRWVEIRRSGI